jgi:tetratricopeptide (TPR) repeat protein
MVNQKHSGSGDNVAGDKFELIIRSIQAGNLMSVTVNIMSDVCYRDLEKAREKLDVLAGISALEADVHLLLQALKVKAELVNTTSDLPAKNNLIQLLNQKNLPNEIREVVTSILIDLESRTSVAVARDRYADLPVKGFYTKEVFYERLVSKEELDNIYRCLKVHDLSEQELTGLVRGAIRVEDFALAYELAKLLDIHFSSNNSATLLLLAEVLFISIENQHKNYVSLSKPAKSNLDRLISQLLSSIVGKNDIRHIVILTNLLNLTQFSDRRLYDLGRLHIDEIRKISPNCANYINPLNKEISNSDEQFELSSQSLDLEQFSRLDIAIQSNKIKANVVNKWVDRGGSVQTGDDYFNAFFDLYLRASVCSGNDKEEIQSLDDRARQFFESDPQRFILINPNALLRLSEIFIELGLPLNAVNYLAPFLSVEAWVSPLFECYLTALFASEKFDLFLSRIKHLEPEEKTLSICLREAQVYERLNEYELSINSIRAAIKISPNIPYPWHLLLHVSRAKGLNKAELSDIVFEIPEVIFSKYDHSKVALINEIATHIDINIADRVLVDWFAQNPNTVAAALIDIHNNSMRNRPTVTSNPYVPRHCCDGVTFTDGFENSTRLLVRDVSSDHPLLLDIESPLGQTLNSIKTGASSGIYTMLERLPSYVAAFRHALEIRHKGNDGTDAFRMFSLPATQEDLIPYFEKILKQYSSHEKRNTDILDNPNIPLVMRAHYTDTRNPVRGAIAHLCSNQSTKHIGLFSGGEELPSKVIIDAYTAVYLSLMGFVSCFTNLNIEIALCQRTKKAIESWLEDVLRDDYMSMGVSEQGLFRITSKDIQRDYLALIQELKVLLKYAKVEILKPSDTPEILVRVRDIIDETVYSTYQLSAANSIPLLSIDHLMTELLHRTGCPAANINSFVMRALNSLSLKERKKSILLNLHLGTPVSILYKDILELSRSLDSADTYLVFKFIEKYGEKINATGEPLNFLTEIVRNVTAAAYIDGNILNGGRAENPRYDGYAEHVFNACSRAAIKILSGETAEQRLATLIYNVVDIPCQMNRYFNLIFDLASEFATGHFLDIDACNHALASLQIKAKESSALKDNH